MHDLSKVLFMNMAANTLMAAVRSTCAEYLHLLASLKPLTQSQKSLSVFYAILCVFKIVLTT